MTLNEFLLVLKEKRDHLVIRRVPRAKPTRSLQAQTIVISFSDALSTRVWSMGPLGRSVALVTGSFVVAGLLFSFSSMGSMQARIGQMNKKMSLLENSYFALQDENAKLRDELRQIQEDKERIEKRLQEFSSVKLRDRRIAMQDDLKSFFLKKVPSGWPMGGTIVSPFGLRYHPIFHRRIFHEGVDISAGIGTPVHTTADGVVLFVGWKSGYGNIVVINHMHGFQTAYAHLSRARVKLGQRVYKGDVVAFSGNTGISTGPHLHYEVRFHGSVRNPSNFIAWNMANYESIFKREDRIRWASLIERTKQYQKVALQSSRKGFKSKVN